MPKKNPTIEKRGGYQGSGSGKTPPPKPVPSASVKRKPHGAGPDGQCTKCKCIGWVRPMASSVIKQAQILLLAWENGCRAMADFHNAQVRFRAGLETATAAIEQLREQILNSDSDTPPCESG